MKNKLFVLLSFTNVCLYHALHKKAPTNQKELIEHMKDAHVFLEEEVEKAMAKVDRKHYVDIKPYSDTGHEIGFGAEISHPAQAALTLELLHKFLFYGSRALDIGSGSGYVTACMALLLGEPGYVVGIDHIPSFAQKAYNNVMADNPELITSGKVKFITGDGRLGAPDEAPFDAILVGGSLPAIPQVLVDQIKSGGRMVIPIGGKDAVEHKLIIVDKDPWDNVTQFHFDDVYYRPLTTVEDQMAVKDNTTLGPLVYD